MKTKLGSRHHRGTRYPALGGMRRPASGLAATLLLGIIALWPLHHAGARQTSRATRQTPVPLLSVSSDVTVDEAKTTSSEYELPRPLSERPPRPANARFGSTELLDDDTTDDVFADDFDDGDDDGDGDGDDPELDQFVQELFLGEIVYPQERHEWQFTAGYFWGDAHDYNRQLPIALEFGLTDRFQVSVEATANLRADEDHETLEGFDHVEFGAYYNFYQDPCRCRAMRIGFEFGLPTSTPEDDPRELEYEPFFIAYQQIGCLALNFSAALEIEDPRGDEEETETSGKFALAAIRPFGSFVSLLEVRADVEQDATPVRLAPGMFWRIRPGLEWGASLPIGLNDDAPEWGTFTVVVYEFGGDTE